MGRKMEGKKRVSPSADQPISPDLGEPDSLAECQKNHRPILGHHLSNKAPPKDSGMSMKLSVGFPGPKMCS